MKTYVVWYEMQDGERRYRLYFTAMAKNEIGLKKVLHNIFKSGACSFEKLENYDYDETIAGNIQWTEVTQEQKDFLQSIGIY